MLRRTSRHLPWTALDAAIVSRLPQPLAPLAGPLGPMMSLSGGRRAGPAAALVLGLLFGGIAFALASVGQRRTQPP